MKSFIDVAGVRGGVNGILFYPKERIDEIFSRTAGARGTDRETEELRIFYLRMLRVYKDFSYEINTLLDDGEKEEDRKYRWEAIGEAVEDAAFLESIGAPVEPLAAESRAG
jgi:hypothetical protein